MRSPRIRRQAERCGREPDRPDPARHDSDEQDRGSDLGAVVDLEDVLVEQADAAGRRLSPDLADVVGAVDAVGGPAEVEGANAVIAAGDIGVGAVVTSRSVPKFSALIPTILVPSTSPSAVMERAPVPALRA